MTKLLTFEWQKDDTCTIYINGDIAMAGLTDETLSAVAPGLESLANSLGYVIEIKRVG